MLVVVVAIAIRFFVLWIAAATLLGALELLAEPYPPPLYLLGGILSLGALVLFAAWRYSLVLARLIGGGLPAEPVEPKSSIELLETGTAILGIWLAASVVPGFVINCLLYYNISASGASATFFLTKFGADAVQVGVGGLLLLARHRIGATPTL